MEAKIQFAVPFFVVIFLWGVGSGMLIPILPLYIRHLGFSIEYWGYLVMVYAVSIFVFEWFWGVLSDFYDRRLFIAVGLMSGSFSIFLYTLRGLTPFFHVLQFVRGVLFIMVAPSVKATVSYINESEGMGLSMGLYSATRRLGGVLGPFLGSLVAHFWSYEAALYLYSVLYILAAVIAVIGFKRWRAGSSHSENKLGTIIGDLKSLFATSSISTLFILPVILFMARTAIASYLPIYAQEIVKMTTVEVGTLFSVGNIAGFLTTPLFGWLSDKLERRHVALSCFILSAVMLIGFSLARTAIQLGLVMIIFTVIFSPLTPMFLAMLADASPSRLMGASMGVYSSFENLGIILAPPIYSMVWNSLNPGAVFLFSALTQFPGVLLLTLSGRQLKGGGE